MNENEIIGKEVMEVRESDDYNTPQEIVLEDGTVIHANGWSSPETPEQY